MNYHPFNLLATAQSVIGKQTFSLRKALGRTENEAGYFITEYSEPVEISDTVIPVKSSQYKSMGLDFKKKYIKIYSLELIEALDRNSNADQIIYGDFVWDVADKTGWFETAGWDYVLCVRGERYDG